MPKETIQRPNGEGTSTELSVHWDKTGPDRVQIGLTRHVGDRLILDGSRYVHADHANCTECVDEHELKATVYSDPLTRREVNDFIRGLRRARDAAFGADA